MSKRTRFVEVNSPDEIPDFASEDEEHEFWRAHSFGPGMLKDFRRLGDLNLEQLKERHRSRTITLRIEEDLLRRAEALAERKGMRYQTLLKTFIVERLYEEEKREGLVG